MFNRVSGRVLVLLCLSSVTILTNCGEHDTSMGSDTGNDQLYYTTESALVAVATELNVTEGAVVSVLNVSDKSLIEKLTPVQRLFNPPTSGCILAGPSSARTGCVSGTDAIIWHNCGVDGLQSYLNGTWNETYNNNPNCLVPMPDGTSMTRTSPLSSLLISNDSFYAEDTNGGAAWDGTPIPATGTAAGNIVSISGGIRSVTIPGNHRFYVGFHGTRYFDHFIVANNLQVSGSYFSLPRTLATGSATVYHNIAMYTATVNFNNITWNDPSCCYPTSGNMTASYTGSQSGSSTLTFNESSGSCNQAQFTDNHGNTSTVTLTQCF